MQSCETQAQFLSTLVLRDARLRERPFEIESRKEPVTLFLKPKMSQTGTFFVQQKHISLSYAGVVNGVRPETACDLKFVAITCSLSRYLASKKPVAGCYPGICVPRKHASNIGTATKLTSAGLSKYASNIQSLLGTVEAVKALEDPWHAGGLVAHSTAS